MIYVVDACTFINLVNSDVITAVTSLPENHYWVSEAVKKESITAKEQLLLLLCQGQINLIDSTKLPAFGFIQLKDRFGLGDGETECLQVADIMGYSMACDDAAARRAARQLLGDQRITGSIGLLKQCVTHNFLSSLEAFQAYERMKATGGFLPNFGLVDF